MAIEWTDVPHSSNVSRVGYDPEAQEMTVEFSSGGVYSYGGVSAQTASDLASDPSPGSFLNRHVKGKYPTRKL